MIKELFEKEELKNYVLSQESECKSFIAELKKEARESLEILKHTDIEKEKKEKISFELIYLFQDLKFSQLKILEIKFQKIGLHFALDWFIPLEKIINEIDKINKMDGIYMPPYTALFHIDWHLNIKMIDSVLKDLGMDSIRSKGGGDTSYNNLYLIFFRLKKSIKYYKEEGKEFEGTKNEFILKNLLNTFENIGARHFNNKDLYQEIITGGTEKTILNNLFNSVIFSPSSLFSKTEKYVRVYELFKLIMPDKRESLLSKEEFLEKSGNYSYGENYRKFQKDKLKKFLTSTKKKKN